MKTKISFMATLLCALMTFSFVSAESVDASEKVKTDANIVGHVTCNGEHIAFATITVEGTTIGTTTDETGHFHLVNLPEGELTITASMVGYKTATQTLIMKSETTEEIKIELKEDILNLDELVVSADRNAQKRVEAPVIVNTLTPKLMSSTQSITLGESLNFTPGLRLENNCQNCGFSQVRMNGMEGPYSQILINSRPIFSGLAGVYGLELIPTNMIERVEIVRGGGSALYGSNAIAGTINLILKDPISNTYEAGVNYAQNGVGVDGSGGSASDYSVDFNGSIVSSDNASGLSIYGFTRERDMFDANDDGFSEMSQLKNITFGARAFHKFSHRDKLALDFFAINEEREGGEISDKPYHERDIAECLTHNMKVASLTYDRFFREYDLLSAYASIQSLKRDSYYGAEQSMSDYGYTKGLTYNIGVQYKALLGENSSLVAGVENTGDYLNDKKLGYPEYTVSGDSVFVTHTENTQIADQELIMTGVFAQYDIRFGRLKASAGLRYDHYDITDNVDDNNTSGDVFSPRLSLMYNITPALQARGSYSHGFRAPQVFDEDLHIESSGAGQIIHENDADLKQETSHSYMLSLDFNKMLGKVYTGFLIEGFYTELVDAFSNEIGEQNADGEIVYTRINSSGATVQGVNMELNLAPVKTLKVSAGLTLQTSKYNDEQEDYGTDEFMRAPNTYGFFTLDWDFAKAFCLSTTGNYTGEMLVPYMDGEVVNTSDSFFDLGAKISYTYKINGASVQIFGGMKNIFNSYQDDFDTGINRDPAYIYGPVNPRTIYCGLRFGNIL